MLSIKSNVINELVIKKSKFITFLYKVDDVESANEVLNNLNAKYKDATHICYAYIIDGVKRFSDNGEPGGTAGMPILGVLENKNLDHILCCVVRYFGGVKLGANGLVRAYSSSCSEAISNSIIIQLVLGKFCSISFNYDETKIIDSMLSGAIVVNKDYNDKVSYVFKIDLDLLSLIQNELLKYNLSIIEDCYIEKDI